MTETRQGVIDPDRPRLTEREYAVLAELSAGHTNKQIAAELKISPHTVAKHLQHIYIKLGVPNRTAALRQLRDPGGE